MINGGIAQVHNAGTACATATATNTRATAVTVDVAAPAATAASVGGTRPACGRAIRATTRIGTASARRTT